mgnify:CR=1 FL=1
MSIKNLAYRLKKSALSFHLMAIPSLFLLALPAAAQDEGEDPATGTETTTPTNGIHIGGNVYGGGNLGETKGNTTVTVYAGDLNEVFGGARQANVGGHAFVNIDGEHASNYILINRVYGGNDISGTIGSSDALPEEIEKAGENLVDKTWNAFVRISTKTTTTTTGEGDNAVTETTPAADAQKVYIGQLFGGGNGDYDYTTSSDYYGKSAPELAKTYLEVMGGSIVYAFGGGNNATITEKTVIYVNNPSAVVNSIKDAAGNELLTDERIAAMGYNPGYTYPTSDAFQIGSFFGGNNLAEMKIRPRWNLQSGRIRNLYSGGNKGDMTSSEGLLLEIPETSTIVVDNVYGGCRMANVTPKDVNGAPTTATSITEDDFGNELHIPGGFAARTRIQGGHVTNVYGGNDITGRVAGGSTVGIYTTVYGDVYGGGNGSYPYTDNVALKDHPTYGDLYYTIPDGKTSVEALNDFRPNAEQVSIYVQGTETKKTIVHGSIYCGGNSASLSSSMSNPKVELKIGSYVIADNVFLGNNGENMVQYNEEEKVGTVVTKHEGVLRTMQRTDIASDESEFNSINLTDDATFASYMDGVTMKMSPSVVFANEANDDPADYIPYSSYFGSIYCGGNVGSMKIDGKKTSLNFTESIIVYNKVVGGCNNANVEASNYNAAYEGGFIGNPDTNGDKLQLNFGGLKIQPLRWKVERDNDYNILYYLKDGTTTTDESAGGEIRYIPDDNLDAQLEWNTVSASTGYDVAPVTTGTGPTGDDDLDRRLTGGHIYGGCYNSGHINGNVTINLNSSVVDRTGEHAVFDQVEQEEGEAKLYENDSYYITQRISGVILDEQGMDVLGSALNVFGGGYGKDSEIWGSVTINLNAGYTFQIFGGGERGVIGKPNDGEGDDYSFNGKTYKYNPKYSCTINVKGDYQGVPRNAPGDHANMAAAEFIYGGGFEGPICGNTTINLGNGRVFNTFAGSCNADILGHTETYVGRNTSNDSDTGFPYVRDHIYGGNDLGGHVYGSEDFSARVSSDILASVHGYSETTSPVLTASAYTEYVQGRVDYIFGGCYGDYDYSDTGDYHDYQSPRMDNAFVNFKPNRHTNNSVNKVFGAGQGQSRQADKDDMQQRSYVLIDIPQDLTTYSLLEVFGAGAFCGVGMSKEPADVLASPNLASAIIDLMRGQIATAYGGSWQEGITRRTVVNVPAQSTISIGNIFGGAFGTQILPPCDVYESNVNYHNTSELAKVTGAIYGGNNNERRTLYTHVNISSPVWSDKDEGYLAKVYGAGKGIDTWSEYTEVNLLSGARVFEVYGGGEMGHVLNAESVQKYMQLYKSKPSNQISTDDPKWSKAERWNGEVGTGTIKSEYADEWTTDWKNAWELGQYYQPDDNFSNYVTNELTNLTNSHQVTMRGMDDRDYTGYTDDDKARFYQKYNTNVIINEGATVVNYAYGGGWGQAITNLSGDVYGTTYIALLGGKVKKDIYAAGTSGSIDDLFGVGAYSSTNPYGFTASANAYIKGGTCRNVYGGGWAGAVGLHGFVKKTRTNNKGEEETYRDYLDAAYPTLTSTEGDVSGETHVVIGDIDGTSFTNGIPAIERNAYGGGEGGPVFGTSNITLNKGYIGYRYFTETPTDPYTFFQVGDGYYQEKLDDETWNGDGTGRLVDSGNIFGGGYVDNSYVDRTNVLMYGGHVRNALFGGGEIAAIGRGIIIPSGEDNSVRTLKGIYKAGHTSVTLYGGHVHRNVFGGGRGYNNLGEGGSLYSDGYVFGQTEVNIFGGEVGTTEELAKGNGNVFGGGDIGYVYSAYEEDGKLFVGIKDGERYDGNYEGYYYAYRTNDNKYEPENFTYSITDPNWVKVDNEFILTEDCKVLIEPHCKVTAAIDGDAYAVGDFVTIDYLNTLGNKNDTKWQSIDDSGITIHNAVFAGGNTSSGSSKVYANATSIFGNVTASINDVYHRDLISLGTNHTGGLYGDGNLTFVDGYRGLNITNYGTDYYSIATEITIEDYESLPPREQAYYELRYSCIKECTDDDGTTYHPKDSENPNSKASTLSALEILTLFKNGTHTTGVIDGNGNISDEYWEENGVLPVYAGRPMNTIQRSDFCGVFGSRMVMQGAEDRVPEIADYTNYTINRVREVSLNKVESTIGTDAGTDRAFHGNYFGIYNIVNYLGALTSDVDFQGGVRTTDNTTDDAKYKSAADGIDYGTATYAQWKKAHKDDRTRNNGSSHNKVALASGVYLELTSEESTGNGLYEKHWGLITGVVELDLINVQTGIGGGFVYARNEHGIRSSSGLSHITVASLNSNAVTQRHFTYATDDPDKEEWQTSGNFVHSTQTIIDDCYNVSGKYKGSDKVPAHYWYIKGDIYVYDQYISAYTGSPNAYSESVEIPLTITAASHGTMKLLNVQPNYYAYYASAGVALNDEQKLIINDVTYYKNDPISYWDYYLLSASEKALFVKDTYVVIGDCKIGYTEYKEGTVLLPEEYNTLKNLENPTVTYMEGDVEKSDKPFDYFIRPSNNLSHDTGYILTYKVNNPTPWDTWYTKYESATAEKSQTSGEGIWNNGPTYHLTGTGGMLGQQQYKESDVISETVHNIYQNAITNNNVTFAADKVQAEFEKAYIITDEVDVTDGSSTHHLYPGAVISLTDRTNFGLSDSNSSEAYICTSTIQLSATEYIYLNSKMSSAEKNAYITQVENEIKALPGISDPDNITDDQIAALTANQKNTLKQLLAIREDINTDIVPAYYCTKAGLYGGNYYQNNTNYRGLEAWSSMSKNDRNQFTFNYDALDLLIDPTYGGVQGKKYQYDAAAATLIAAEANDAGYSLEKPVDYTATYNGGKTDTYNGVTLENGREYSRTDFEKLPNEKRYYSGIVVESPGTYYVVNTSFQIGNTTYAVGTTISSTTYNSLSSTDQNYITQLSFSQDQINANKIEGAIKPFYYCRENYTVSTATGGTAVTGLTNIGAAQTGTYSTDGANKDVPIGLVISAGNYKDLVNEQEDFTIHGIAPTEISTLYVSRESDIFDLSKEKIITVIYQYDYEESDSYGNITPQSERHVVNIHLTFKSGIPLVEDIKVPQIILPGDYVALREPNVTPGAYQVTGGGWEIFQNINDAENHTNGIAYSPNFDELYWYQNGYYVAYYAQTYLGKTYSNHVPLSVANYHDLATVMNDTEHHYYIDHEDVDREPKIYINDYSSSNGNGLQLFHDLIDLTNGHTLAEHSPLDLTHEDKPMTGGEYLEFFLRANLTAPSGETIWSPVANGSGECFSGNLHGDGYYISGLTSSLFGHLCGNVYNLGVMGSFTSAGIADEGKGFVENCWTMSTATSDFPTGTRAVFGNPTRDSGIQIRNCYYLDTNTYPITTDDGRGIAKPMPAKAFYNGTVAYDLNEFYLAKRYYDNNVPGSGNEYVYYKDIDGTLTRFDGTDGHAKGKYGDEFSDYQYVEDRFADGDFRYADGVIPATEDVRTYTDTDGKNSFYPIWPDDYLFFGQMLTYGWNESQLHEDVPSHLSDNNSNRVYRAPAYFRSNVMDVAHYNPNAIFAARSADDAHEAYPNMTAIDFTGYNDNTWHIGTLDGTADNGYPVGKSVFYPPLLDDDGLTGFRNIDLTQNLLVYTGTASTASSKTHAVVSAYLPDVAFNETNETYRTVATADASGIKGHQVVLNGSTYTTTNDHLLVDKQDFNCPISYTMGDSKRMWYQRKPDRYVDTSKGWEAISLPFKAELVTTQNKGEITHFYSGSPESDKGTKIGAEYWLREYRDITALISPTDEKKAEALFNYPDNGTDGNKTVTNTFLWDYYYEASSGHSHQDANNDTYQTYYNSSRTYNNYPRLANGTPYLIGFPGVTYYEFDLSGNFEATTTATPNPEKLGQQTITFASAGNDVIAVSDDETIGVSHNGYTFKPSYLNESLTEGYILNDDGSAYTALSGSTTEPVKVHAFRPYFIKNTGGAPAYSHIYFSNDATSLQDNEPDMDNDNFETLDIASRRGKIVVTSSLRQEAEVGIFNPGGALIDTYTIKPGETIETNIYTQGVYIVRAHHGRYIKKLVVK